jgi:hypothetical protein
MLHFIRRWLGWDKPAYKYFAKRCYENSYYRWNLQEDRER